MGNNTDSSEFVCGKCGNPWTTNYCPLCGVTIDRTRLEPPPSAADAKGSAREPDQPIAAREPVVMGRKDRRSARDGGTAHPLEKTHWRTAADVNLDNLKARLTNRMLLAGVILSIGLGITLFSYQNAEPGERYVLASGAIVVGLVMFAKSAIWRMRLPRSSKDDRS